MKLISIVLVVILVLAMLPMLVLANGPGYDACWGQASAVFAQMGYMGEHSSSQETPREGLANLARRLLGDDATMADLGAVVADLEGLSIDACMD